MRDTRSEWRVAQRGRWAESRMRKLVLGVLVLVSIGVAAPTHAQDDAPPSLNDIVAAERQKALGLDKLSESERDSLLQLLVETYQAGFAKGRSQKQPADARPVAPATPQVVESKIDGEFEGWEGETVLKLMNGQIWKQTEYYYHYHYAFMPDVLIYRSGGGYKMKVEGVDRPVGVERLK